MNDLEHRLATRLQTRGESYAVHSDFDAVIAGIAHLPVIDRSTAGRRRWSVVIAGACVAAAASVMVVLAVMTRSGSTNTTVPAAGPDSTASPANTSPESSPFAPYIGDAPLVEAQRITGATLYTAPALAEDQTCLLIELDEGSIASCGDAGIIQAGDFWFKSSGHDDDPQLLAGLVGSDVTAVEVDGVSVPLINNTWALFTMDAISSYTLTRNDGTTHTVSIEPAGAPTGGGS